MALSMVGMIVYGSNFFFSPLLPCCIWSFPLQRRMFSVPIVSSIFSIISTVFFDEFRFKKFSAHLREQQIFSTMTGGYVVLD